MQTALRLVWLALCVAGCVGWFETKRYMKFCNGTSYMTDEKICCSKRLFMRYDNDACCGGLPHDSDETGCCAGLQYKLDSYICCQGKVEPRRSRDSCCGALPYDSSEAECHDGEIYVRYHRNTRYIEYK
ncbi:hypothetical protein NP493_380g02048 [Ridgeia piscesae]|uniref:Galaxin-like repeats domain-containing protein n=1 Tax=Ridgeia piscesae TaxID=27915 RepID=A0AAD9L2I4_RIDPI|nr:hypothetical protein NP493_380g02048 [Ridgeia piscesae]